MKKINLPVLGRVTMEESIGLLLWLAKQATSDINMNRLERTPPLRTSELKPALKALEQFNLITVKEARISITIPGLEFLRSEPPARKTFIRTVFERMEWVQTLLELLKKSPSGRIPKSAINEAVKLHSGVPIAESEVLGFIGWAESCEIFLYDEKRGELILLESRTPRDPHPVAPNLRLAS